MIINKKNGIKKRNAKRLKGMRVEKNIKQRKKQRKKGNQLTKNRRKTN